MTDQNTTANFYYDSDEDVCWGPITLREIKRDLKRKAKLNPNYRRQTAAFIPLPAEENQKMSSFTSSHSSKDYITANESLESNNIGITGEMLVHPENNISQVDSSKCSDRFQSIENMKDETEVVTVSSDSEDETSNIIDLSSSEDEEPPPSEEQEQDSLDTSVDFAEDKVAGNDGPSPVNQSVYKTSAEEINSSESEESSRQIPTIRTIAGTPIKERKYSSNHSTSQYYDSIDEGIANSPKKRSDCSSNSSTTGNYISVDNIEHSSLSPTEGDEIIEDISEEERNNQKHNSVNDNEVSGTSKQETPKVNIISDVPIKRTNYFAMSYSASQENSLVELSPKSNTIETEKSSMSLSHESDERIKCEDNSFGHKNSDQIRNSIINTESNNDHVTTSLNNSINTSQNENEYDYCEEVNHTLSKLASELSLNSEKLNDSTNSHELNEIRNGKFNKSNNNSRISSQLCDTQDDYVSSLDDDQIDHSLNDTFAEMQRLLSNGFETDSDEDSLENFIESTPSKTSKLGNSKIPVPKSDNDSNSYSSFKVPKFPQKLSKKTPITNKMLKVSPLAHKYIISPVRLYINNSPFPALKQNNKPGCTQSQHTPGGVSVAPRKHRNLLDSLPEVVYKPSKLVQEKCDDQIILPNNIRKLITETTVIKHEPRKRINFDDSVLSVEEKLKMSDISCIVSDDQNMSVHVKKQGFNL